MMPFNSLPLPKSEVSAISAYLDQFHSNFSFLKRFTSKEPPGKSTEGGGIASCGKTTHDLSKLQIRQPKEMLTCKETITGHLSINKGMGI